MARHPIRELPAAYREVEHLVVTEGRRVLWLNLLALPLLVVSLLVMAGWWQLVLALRGPIPANDPPTWLALPLTLLVLPLHELVHVVVIALAGQRPRVGAKLDKGVLYATADNAYFRRGEFIAVALAPLVVITVVGLALVVVLPDALGYWVGLAVVLNAGGAIGDLWMTYAVLQHPSDSLVLDEADGIRIYEMMS